MNELKHRFRCRRLILIWDGLPSHKSRAMTAYLQTQRSWLTVERLPGYAPDLNPTESAALDRMNAGEYGTCAECDAPISLARLTAMPEAQTCVRCQGGLERLGQPRPMIYSNRVHQQRNRRNERAAARHWPQGGAELAPENSNVVITARTRARLTGPAWQPRNAGR